MIDRLIMLRFNKVPISLSILQLIIYTFVTVGLAQTESGNWRSYGADQAGTKYAPLNQIHRGNVHLLSTAWRWQSVDQPILNSNQELWTWKYEATPLMIDGVLYTSTYLKPGGSDQCNDRRNNMVV